jgi:glucose/arabinose dehydrogenase
MKMFQWMALVAALAETAVAGSVTPFNLDLSGFGPAVYTVQSQTIASGLEFPYGMAAIGNGSILFGESTPQTVFGVEGGPSVGSVWMLPKQPDGSFAAPLPVITGLSGPVTDVRVSPDGLILVDSGAASGRSMTLYNSSYQQIGALNFTYPTQNWEHSVGMSAIAPQGNGTDRVFFIVGAEGDTTKTTDQVTTSGLFSSTLNADSVYMIDLKVSGNSVQALSSPVQVAAGLRNPFGLTLDSAGDLIIGDNGQDGPHVVNQLSADTLNVIPAADLGNTLFDFGFPNSYTDFATGMRVNGDPGATDPLVSFLPIPNSMSQLQYSEGLAGMAYAAPGEFPFVGALGGEFIGFHGVKNGTGPANYDAAFLYYDFASGKYTAIVDDGTAGVGHLDTAFVLGSSLFLADFSTAGIVDGVGGDNSGAIYQFDFTATPEPGTQGLVAAALLAVALLAKARGWRTFRKAALTRSATAALPRMS